MKNPLFALAIVVGSITPAAAQPPSAIVEDVQGKVKGVEFMDYVAPGKVIKLGTDGIVVLGYMKSCWRETIRGGVAVVGAEESRTAQSDVRREKVSCDTKPAALSDREATQGAATTFRSMGAKDEYPVVYGLSPVIELTSPGKLLIERIDVPGERYETAVTAKMLVKGKFYDLATTGRTLMPGGTYAAALGTRKTVFKVDPFAHPGAGPIVGRLVRL
jgi:hypothetical protein